MNELLKFMIRKMGGFDILARELIADKLAELDVPSMTVDELLRAASRDGFEILLQDLTLAQFTELYRGALPRRAGLAERGAVRAGEGQPSSKGSSRGAASPARQPRRPAAQSLKLAPAPQEQMAPTEPESKRRRILDYLGDHPWSAPSVIADGASLSVADVCAHLDELTAQGFVKTVGEGPNQRFALG